MIEAGYLAKPDYGVYDLPENVPEEEPKEEETPSVKDIIRSIDRPGKREIDGLMVWSFHAGRQRGSAGSGAYPDEGDEELETIVRSRFEVKRLTGMDARRLEGVFVGGDSMKDEIQPNTPALYLPMNDFQEPGIYYFNMEGRDLIKRVSVMAGGAVRVRCSNKERYPNNDEELLVPLKEADTANTYRSEVTGLSTTLKVHGRIVIYAVST